MNVKFDYKLGKQSDNEWSGVFGYRPESIDETQELGEIYAVFRFSTDVEGFALDMFSKILLETLQRSFFEDLKSFRSTLDRLEEACWKMKSKMEMLLAREPEVAELGIDMEMVVSVVLGDYFYAVGIGESRLFIFRNGSLVEITEGLIDKDKKGFIKSASLQIEEGDRFLLATSKTIDSEASLFEGQVEKLRLINLDKAKTGLGLLLLADESENWPAGQEEEGTIQEEIVNTDTSNKEAIQSNLPNDNDNDFASEVESTKDDIKAEDIESNIEKAEESDFIKEFRNRRLNLDDDLVLNSLEEGSPITNEGKEETFEPKESIINRFKTRFGNLLSNFGRKNREDIHVDSEDSDIAEDFENDKLYIADHTKKSSNKFTGKNVVDASEELIDEIEAKDIGNEYNSKTNSIFQNLVSRIKSILTSIKGFFVGIVDRVVSHFRNNEQTYAHIVNTFVKNIKRLLFKLNLWFKRNILGQTLDRRDLRKVRVKRNRYLFGLFVVVFAIFIYSSYSTNEYNKKVEAAKKNFDDKVSSYNTEVTQISSSVSVSIEAEENVKTPILGKIQSIDTNLRLLQSELSSNEYVKNKDEYNSKIASMISANQAERDRLLLIQSFTQPQVIVDTSKEFPDSSLSDIEYAEGAIFIADSGRNAIYRVTPEINSSLQTHISGLVAPKLLVKNVANEIIVYDNSDVAVVGKFSPVLPNSFSRFQNLTPPTTGTVEEVAIFSGNDALYELRTDTRQIFRRTKSGDGYISGGVPYQETAETNWRTDEIFATAVDIETPGSIYVLSKGFGIARFFGGGANDLAQESIKNIMSGDTLSIKNADALDVEATFLAIGDSNGKKIMLFEIQPDGSLKLLKQMQFRGEGNIFANIKELQINAIDRKIFVLDANRVIRLDF